MGNASAKGSKDEFTFEEDTTGALSCCLGCTR